VIGSDGVFSVTRAKYEAHFNPRIALGKNRFIWLGTRKKLDAFTFGFKETEWGWFNLHAYRFDEEWSTFIVETPEETWRAAGLDQLDPDDSVALCERLFSDLLDGNKLVSNAQAPARLGRLAEVQPRALRALVQRQRRVVGRRRAHRALLHRVGTKLAMEDAIALAKCSRAPTATCPTRLARYQPSARSRRSSSRAPRATARTWFEDIERYVRLEPEQFVFSLLTGSQRVGHANQKLRDPGYVARSTSGSRAQSVLDRGARPADVHALFAARDDAPQPRRRVADVHVLRGRRDAGDFHLVHYGSARRMGGAGLLFTEMTCVSPDGASPPGCTGSGHDAHDRAWKRIVDFVHASGATKVAMQLGHAGARARRSGRGRADQPLDAGRLGAHRPVAAAVHQGRLADAAGDDPRGHGRRARRLRRGDAARGAGGLRHDRAARGARVPAVVVYLAADQPARGRVRRDARESRCRFPLEVFRAIRAVWTERKPMSVRISAHDWVQREASPRTPTEVARLFKDAGWTSSTSRRVR
jgi:anthraniloyl-CoA monooxygenase